MKNRPAALVALVALLLGGCAVPTPPESGPPPTSTPVISDAVATPLPTVEPSALPALAARETSHDGTPLVIAVNSLHSTPGSLTLNFTITNRGSKPWRHWTALSTLMSGKDSLSVSGVYVIDPEHGRRLLPARDAAGACVCSTLGGQEIGVGQSMVLSAVFAPLPEELHTAAVHIPLAGTFDQVPVSR